MSKKDKHISDLLKNWISGDIRATQEQQLDQAAEQDAFVKEALAGMRATPEHDHQKSIEQLRAKLGAQNRKTTGVFRMPIVRVAAAVLLLISATWLVLQNPLADHKEMAMTQAAEPQADDQKKAEPLVEAEAAELKQEEMTESEEEPIAATEANAPVVAAKAEARPEKVIPEPAETIKEDALADLFGASREGEGTGLADGVSVMLEDEQAEEIAEEQAWPSPSPAATRADQVLAASERNTDSVNTSIFKDQEAYTQISNSGRPIAVEGRRIISGKVLDSDGYVLIGVNIEESGTDNRVFSDIDGSFELAVKNTDATAIVCTYPGFEAQQVQIDAAENYEVVLQENTLVLEEVVVADYAQAPIAKKTKASKPEQEQTIAEPIGGFKAYKKYIKENTPQGVGRARVHLAFSISSEGQPIDIEVIESNNEELNTLAKQLLTYGPKWQYVQQSATPEIVNYWMQLK